MTCAHKVDFDNLVLVLKKRTEVLVAILMQLLEASIADGRQCDAVKNLARKAIWDWNREGLREIEKSIKEEINDQNN